MKKTLTFSISALLFLTSCLLLGRGAESTPETIPVSPSPAAEVNFEKGLIPEYRGIVQELSDASSYTLEFIIAEDLYHISGSESIRYTNTEDVSLSEIQLRLFPNILGGEMLVENIKVNGKDADSKYSLKNSLLIIRLQQPLEIGESLMLSMDFKISVPQSVELNYGVQAYYEDVLALAHAYPMIAVYDDEGWNSEIPPQSGDVTYADMSFFVVTVDAPKDLTIVSSGREIKLEENGSRQTVRVEAGPVRDFYLAASPVYEVVTKEVNGITLRFYTRAKLQAAAEYALDVAARAIEVYGSRYAPYPYTELDFVSTPTYALGIEYPGMIAITEWIMQPGHEYLEGTVAHEVGHQWFYNLVGNDQLDDPWLDESLTQFATLQYFDDKYGQINNGFRADIEGRWSLIGNEAIPVGLPVRDYLDAEYSGIVYGRGALFFEALRIEMGVESFDLFMKDYVKSNSWKIATPEKLKSIAEAQCGCDLTPIFKKWVYP